MSLPKWFPFLLLFAVAAVPATADFNVEKSVRADTLTLNNLIGEVVVEGHGGSGFEVEISVQGADADPELIEVDLQDGSNATLSVYFPVDQTSEGAERLLAADWSRLHLGSG